MKSSEDRDGGMREEKFGGSGWGEREREMVEVETAVKRDQ